MKALLQRVTEARVVIDGQIVGAIGPGLLVLLGVEVGDDEGVAERLLQRVLQYRIFADAEGRMNLNVAQVGGGLLLVSQFTLAADTSKGLRPGFSTAAAPERARELYEYVLGLACQRHPEVATGQFGADMKVHLVNDGPVTFLLEVSPGLAA